MARNVLDVGRGDVYGSWIWKVRCKNVWLSGTCQEQRIKKSIASYWSSKTCPLYDLFRGWWSPAILKIIILIFTVWSWIFQYMLQTSFPSFISKNISINNNICVEFRFSKKSCFIASSFRLLWEGHSHHYIFEGGKWHEYHMLMREQFCYLSSSGCQTLF